MMAFERPTTDNYGMASERPETSKYSRQSRRSDLHITNTDFGLTTTSLVKGNVAAMRDSQTKFYNSKTKFPKTQSFSSLKVSNGRSSAAKETEKYVNTQNQEEYNFDDENNAGKINHNGILPTQEFKQGMTLDKFLGTGFKKIDIHSTSFKEFDKTRPVDDKEIEKIVSELSEPDDKEYQYESFEILETDDEEDTMSEITQTNIYKEGSKANAPKEPSAITENHEVLSKIQNKYKSSKPKYLPKSKPKSFRVRSPLKEKDNIELEKNLSEPMPYDQANHRTSNKSESKSLSPKFRSISSQKKSSMNFIPESGHLPKENNLSSLENLTDTNQSFKNDHSPQHTMNTFYGAPKRSSNPFQNSTDNLRNTSDKFRSTFMRKTSYNKSLIQPNGTEYYEDNRQEMERERSIPRSNSIAMPYKPSETHSKMSLDNKSSATLEQKFTRENIMMTKKIKQSEKEMMDKYARMFKLNQHEVLNLCKENERKPEGVKRLSTPLKEFNSLRGFPKR